MKIDAMNKMEYNDNNISPPTYALDLSTPQLASFNECDSRNISFHTPISLCWAIVQNTNHGAIVVVHILCCCSPEDELQGHFLWGAFNAIPIRSLFMFRIHFLLFMRLL